MANDLPHKQADAELGNGRGGDQDSDSQSSSTRKTNKIIFRKQHDSNCFLFFKWLSIVSMGLILVGFLFYLIPYLTFTLLNNENDCFNQLSPFQQTSYQLFSTKTLYTTTYNYLSKQQQQHEQHQLQHNHHHQSPSSSLPNQQPAALSASSHNHNHNHHQSALSININNNNNNNNQPLSNHYDKSSVYVPKIFSQQDSLETINQRLQSPELGCQVRQLHYIGRHAARLPNSGGIDRINKHIASIQLRIDLDKYKNLNNNNDGQQTAAAQPVLVNNDTGDSSRASPLPPSSDTTNRSEVCFDPLVQYKQWASFAVPEQGNLVTEMGIRETQAIAARFKSMFPEMFNSKVAKVEFGTTREHRTGQTALEFMKLVDNFSLDFCQFNDFPSPSSSFDQSNNEAFAKFLPTNIKSDDLEQNSCFKSLLSQFAKDKLSFHESCRNLNKEELTIRLNLDLKSPNRTEPISASLSKKLKLSKDNQLTSEEVRAIYDACRYESALRGQTSIWCNLFSEKELRFLEYLNDIDDFYNQAYGHPDQSRSSCPVTSELMRSFRVALRQPKSEQQQPEAHFYFTHSEVVQKILAASVDLSQDAEYSPRAVWGHLKRGEAPKERQWQTSLFTPFSANLAFTLYSCPKSTGPLFSSNTATGEVEMDVAPGPLKVVASLNEQPILLDGCSDYACDLNLLIANGRLNSEKKCKLDEICKNKVVVT